MDNEKIFLYDHQIQMAVFQLIPRHPTRKQPNQYLERFTPNILADIERYAEKAVPPEVALFYFLQQFRPTTAAFYPPRDICLLLANIARWNRRPGRLTLLDEQFLSAGILLAGLGWEVSFPEADAYRPILEQYIKDARFQNLPQTPVKGDIVMAGDPLACLMENKYDYVAAADRAVCLGSWDFLGVKSNEGSRGYWLDKGNLSGALQLPRPRRQASAAYPAIVLMGDGGKDVVRLAKLDDVSSAISGMDQKHALALMYGEPDNINSRDVEKSAIKANPGCVLTPAIWLRAASAPEDKDATLLGKCAQIIRCQIRREKVAPDSRIVFGEQEDGSFIAREAGMAALQPQCGILLAGAGNAVRMEFRRRDSQYKYLLRKNDILFSFRGTLESLGKVGFVAREPDEPCITGTAFYILRPLAGVDPVWLFWHLQSKILRGAILARSSGATMLNISVSDVAGLPIQMPEQSLLKSILEIHSELAEQTNEISKLMRDIGHGMELIAPLID